MMMLEIEDDENQLIGAFQEAKLAPISENAVLVSTTASRLEQVSRHAHFSYRYPCKVASGGIHIFSERSFYVLIAEASNAVELLSKRQRVPATTLPLSSIIRNKFE